MEIIEFFFLCLFEFKLLSRIISEMEPRTKAKKNKNDMLNIFNDVHNC